MAETMSLPGGGLGGLMRYDAEYQSRFMFNPSHVVIFLVVLLAIVIGLKVLFPVVA